MDATSWYFHTRESRTMDQSPAEMFNWAVDALKAGRSYEFVVSVVGKRAAHRASIAAGRAPVAPEPQVSHVRSAAERHFPPRHIKVSVIAIAEEAEDQAARAQLRRRMHLSYLYARHWDMIHFLRRCGMSGRTLRYIYGAECLIWAVGGGIDP